MQTPSPSVQNERVCVTGAFGYSGTHITRLLLDHGAQVHTLTNHPNTDFDRVAEVAVHPYAFDAPDTLEQALRGTTVLVNTYWIRYPYPGLGFARARDNCRALFAAAQRAGVQRIVHLSVTNADPESDLAYFRYKGRVEQDLAGIDCEHTIVRPSFVFGGDDDTLVNNLAWSLRRLPVFGVFGRGDFRLRPVHVQDLAETVAAALALPSGAVVNAVGPESLTYAEMVRTVARGIGCRRPILPTPVCAGYLAGRLVGALNHDTVFTWEEVTALTRGLMDADPPRAGTRTLQDYVRSHAERLGRTYHSERARRR
jgi:NADH dehydrogenase